VTESPVAISKATTKFTRMGISRRVAPLGTVPVGTIEAFADMVPWGTNVKGEKGENGFEPIGTDEVILSHTVPAVTADHSLRQSRAVHIAASQGGLKPSLWASA
jgi:hypothetical protein